MAFGTSGATAKCISGEVVTGGGLTGGPVTNSYPTSGPGWVGWFGSNGSGMGTTVYVLCAS